MMGIPSIAPYPMPAEGDLPDNTARWRLRPKRALLLIHDMQRYFVRPFPSDQGPGDALVRNLVALRTACAGLGVPIAYTAQPGDMTEQQRGLLKDFWGAGMAAQPVDRAIIEELTPADDAWLFTKWRYSAFFRSDLLVRMRRAGRDQILLSGVYASTGVLMTALDAFANDVQPFLVADAVADFNERHHRMALQYAAERCAMVITAKAAAAALHEPLKA